MSKAFQVFVTRFAPCAAMILLAACGGTNSPDASRTPPSLLPEAPLPRGTVSPTLIALQRDFEALTQAHEAMTMIWESLADGGTVQCGQVADLVAPGSISAEGDITLEPLAEALRQAAIALNSSLDLWQAECLRTRANPSSEVINSGRLATRAAGDALRAAAPLLSTIQPR